MAWVEGLIEVSRSRGSGLRPWAIAIALFSLSVALRLALEPAIEGMKFLTFYPSIALATLICGVRQGVAVMILSALASWYLLFEPSYSFAIKDAKTIGTLIGFLLVGGFILILVAALRETVRRLEVAKIAQATLFSELQHRVANNLQLVVALLRQAQRDLRNPALAAESLRDAEERIMTMSQLHRRLNDGSAYIEGFEPLLKEVLANAFGKLPVTYRIHLDAAPDLSIDQMTAATLLVNEAALNSAKHVFSKGLGTRFEVSLSRDEAGFLDLTVLDDGPGLSAETVDVNARSLGMGIMESFAIQLGGSLEIGDAAGMSLRVRFAS